MLISGLFVAGPRQAKDIYEVLLENVLKASTCHSL
jgi:hypothetical protein